MIAHSHVKLIHDHADDSYRAETVDATHTLAVAHHSAGDWRVFATDRTNVVFVTDDRAIALVKLDALGRAALDRLIAETEQMNKVANG